MSPFEIVASASRSPGILAYDLQTKVWASLAIALMPISSEANITAIEVRDIAIK